jgi:hypothetical protein
VPQRERGHHHGHDPEERGVRVMRLGEARLEMAGEHDERSVARKHRESEEHRAHADEVLLLLLAQRDQVQAIGGDVVRRGGDRGDDEQRGRRLHTVRAREQRGEGGESAGGRELHRPHPVAARAERVHERRPQRLERVGQTDEVREQGDARVVEPQLLEHEHGQHGDQDVGQALRQIERRDPQPRARGALGQGGRRLHASTPPCVRRAVGPRAGGPRITRHPPDARVAGA